MRRVAVVLFTLALVVVASAASKTLTIYFIDVEGGQSTLIVTPAGQSLLVDAGFAANDFNDTSNRGRDPRRILAAVRDAGVTRIDFLLITHFHADHDGGVVDLARQIPIRTFIDHGSVLAAAEQNVRGTIDAFRAYAAVRAKGRHVEPKPGDRLPLKGVDAVVVSAAGATLEKPLAGAGEPVAACGPSARAPQEAVENPRSTGFLLQFGAFRFLDVGDLTGAPLFTLACPNDLVGRLDVYLVAHHGGADAADPATLAAFTPRVAIVNNGARKGGDAAMLELLHRVPGLDVWQLHRSMKPGAQNFGDERIANLDETTGYWIKLTAKADGSFVVTNARTGLSQAYAHSHP